MKKYKLKFSLALLLIIFLTAGLTAESKTVMGKVVIFSVPQKSIQLKTILSETEKNIASVFSRLGRFINIEPKRKAWALSKSIEEKAKNPYLRTGKILNADIYIVLNISRLRKWLYADIHVIPLNDRNKKLMSNIVIKSRISINIPVKAAREIAYLHKKLKLSFDVLKKYDNSTFLVNAGQFHGLKSGKYQTDSSVDVEVIDSGRYRSIVKVTGSVKRNNNIIPIYPDTGRIIDELDDKIRDNTQFRYGLENSQLKGGDPEKRFIEGICIINTGANLCLPGYGSFLSIKYLGFQTDKSAFYGLALSTGLILTHFTLTEFLTGFKTNFFPGVNDGEKDKNIKDLQYFLWATLPVTFSVSYLDQLAYQFNRKEFLPPFYMYIDETALITSLVFPGGGLFYKGYRFAGWVFYLSEMTLAGYGVYNLENDKKSRYAFIGLGIIKGIELINAYFIRPAYGFYNLEMERGEKRSSIRIGFNRNYRDDNIINLAVSYNY